MSEDAKMTGMTPAVLIRSGMCVDWPPYTRRPTTRLAYWTGILRCPSCMSTTEAVTATMSSTITRKTKSLSSPVEMRSEEHTSELQSRLHLVCRLLLEKKNKDKYADRMLDH